MNPEREEKIRREMSVVDDLSAELRVLVHEYDLPAVTRMAVFLGTMDAAEIGRLLELNRARTDQAKAAARSAA